MDEIEFLIFRKLVETDQLEHVVRGWTVWLDFPEVNLSIVFERGKVTSVLGMPDAHYAPGVKVNRINQFDFSQKEVS